MYDNATFAAYQSLPWQSISVMSDAPPHPGPRPAREREHSLLTFSDRFQLHDEFPLHDWSPTY